MTGVMRQEMVLIKGKWTNKDNDAIIRAGAKGAESDIVVFYKAERFPGWRMGDETTLHSIRRGYLDGRIQRSVIVGTGDDVNALIPGGYSMTAD